MDTDFGKKHFTKSPNSVPQAIHILLCCLLFSASCYSKSDTRQAQNENELEAVYVNAERVKSNNQSVTVATSVVTATPIENGLILNNVDASQAIPSLVATSYNSIEPQYFIRGIGSTGSSAGEDHSVAVYLDDIYLGRTGATSLAYLDLSHVEVHKGPQGTLFGRNAAGGVIQLISHKPSDKQNNYLRLGYGSHNQINASLAQGGQLRKHGDQYSNYRLAVSRQQQDGYVNNINTGSDNLREYENQAARLHIDNQINARFSLLLSADYAEHDSIGRAARKASSNNIPLLIGGFIPLDPPSPDIDEVTLSNDGPAHSDTTGVAAHVNFQLDLAELNASSGWRQANHSILEDVSAVGLTELTKDEHFDLFTQEIRLNAYESNAYKWTAGLFFLSEDIDRIDQTDLSAISDLVNLNPSAIGLPPSTVVPSEIARYDQQAKNTSYAVFAQVELPLSDTFKALIGGRNTFDRKKVSVNATGADALNFGILPNGPYNSSQERSFNLFTGKLGFIYEPSEYMYSYLHFSQGYKSGGFDSSAATQDAFEHGFNPETADTIELGLKSQWLDNRLRSNFSVFYTDYSDLQVFQVSNAGTSFISNAAQAEISGIEFDTKAKVMKQLTGELSCTFLRSEYTDFNSDVDDDLNGQPDDLSGNTLTRSPKSACRAGALFNTFVLNNKPLDINLYYTYQSSMYITPQNRPMDEIDAYGLFDMALTLGITNKLQLSFYGKNLSDQRYKLHTYDADPFVRNNLESSVYAEGTTWGLSVQLKH